MTLIDHALEEAADLQSLVEAEGQTLSSKTGVARSAELHAAILSNDIDELMELQEQLAGLMDQIIANQIDPEHLGMLSDGELLSLMEEHLSRKDMERLLEVRHKIVRAAIFAHVDILNKAKGVPDPEHAPGEALVPKLGKKFVRQGGRMKAKLDPNALRAALGQERWEQVCKAELVPAVPEHIEYSLDDDKLLSLVKADPSVLEIFKACIEPGGYGTSSLYVREIK